MDETNLPLPFVKFFGMTSGASMRGMVGLILMRNIFNCFNFYSIDIVGSRARLYLFCDEGSIIGRNPGMPGISTCYDPSLLRLMKAEIGMAAVEEKGKQIDSDFSSQDSLVSSE